MSYALGDDGVDQPCHIPNMMTSLRANVAQIQWVLTAFMIARTVVMPTLSWLGGPLGNRWLCLTSLGLYLAASMLCGLSWNLETIILFRVLQGMSAGYLMPLGMAILHQTYLPGKRGVAMGVFIAGMSFGADRIEGRRAHATGRTGA